MSIPGIGVMLHQLGGDEETRGVYESIVRKRIRDARMDGNSLRLRMGDGREVCVYDAGQSCCEERYMHTDDSLSDMDGALLLSIEIRDVTTAEDDANHEIQFLAIHTDKGTFVVSTHNEHNGYYGGFAIVIREVKS